MSSQGILLSPLSAIEWRFKNMFNSQRHLGDLYLFFLNRIYWGDIGSLNYTGLKCTPQQNIIRTLHCASLAQSIVSFCYHFPHFACLYLPPPHFPSGFHHTVVCVCVIHVYYIYLSIYLSISITCVIYIKYTVYVSHM